MTTVARKWREPAPVRGALSEIDVAEADVWTDRLRSDRVRAARNQPLELAAITATVEASSRDVGARALILSGSTARARRTRVSDLDYHVIGGRPEMGSAAEDVDLYCDDAETFMAKLRSGDDLVHWSVWYGCVLFDDGVVQSAATHIAHHGWWPDANRKVRQAQRALSFTEGIVDSGDREAALEQVRGILSLTARWLLLAHDVFPLSRDELSDHQGRRRPGVWRRHRPPRSDALGELAASFQTIIAMGHEEHPARAGKRSKAHNLLVRLERYEPDVLRFAHVFRVPFGNHQAEQDIRMVKLQQKISGCWRTGQGAGQRASSPARSSALISADCVSRARARVCRRSARTCGSLSR